ncbi:MAG TPA: protein kinase [Bryobacteraceae bacterium]|jgi:serine/threonine-protein kinase
MPFSAGTKLGPYEILSLLGEGGMGEVWKARDTRLGRTVAIKRLTGEHTGRFQAEARSIAALNHPNICQIYDVGQDYIVMEHVDGAPLRGPLPVAEAVRLALQIASALEEAHGQHILHRDLKPANILITSKGDAKLLDFGLAKPLAGGASDITRTLEGTLAGTPAYMSPEQVKGLELDERSDLFSFGAILAEMITGRSPFRRETVAETLSAVLRDTPDLGAEVPSELAAVLRRLLAKDARDRYPSIAAARASLKELPTRKAAVPRRWRAIAAAGIVVAGLDAVWFVVGSGVWRRLSGPPAIRSIAVLPLDNYSGDPQQDYFAEGMTDELTTELATISQLRVISRGSAMQFKGRNRPPTPEIAKALSVDAIVEGSVIRSGDKVRITAQLIDARADKHLWAHSFERSSPDVLALQDELASSIAHEIRVQLTPAEQSRLSTARRVVPQAYDAYLKGRYWFNRPSDENLNRAIAQFEESVKLDADFVPALSGLSDGYLWAGYNEGVFTATEARPKSKETAEKAIGLDPNSAEAHTSLANFKLWYEYDWAGSEAEFRRALALNPNYAFAHDQFSLGLAFQSRFEESIAEGKRAMELDPLSPQIALDAMNAFAMSGRYEEAKELVKRAVDLDPSYFFSRWAYGWIALQAGKAGEAVPELEKAKAMESPAFVAAWLGYAYGASGDRARAMAALEEVNRRSLHGYVPPFNLALVYLGLGDRSRALDYLERALAADSQWLGWLKNDRVFQPIRSEPRFQALVKKVRLDRSSF